MLNKEKGDSTSISHITEFSFSWNSAKDAQFEKKCLFQMITDLSCHLVQSCTTWWPSPSWVSPPRWRFHKTLSDCSGLRSYDPWISTKAAQSKTWLLTNVSWMKTSECFGTTKRISKKQEDRIRNLRAPILLPFYWRRVMLSQERDESEARQRHRKWRHYLGWIMSFTSSVSCFS